MKLQRLLLVFLIIFETNQIHPINAHLALAMAGQVFGMGIIHTNTERRVTIPVPEPVKALCQNGVKVSWRNIGYSALVGSSIAATYLLWNKNGIIGKEALHLGMLYGVAPLSHSVYKVFIENGNSLNPLLAPLLPFALAEAAKRQEILRFLVEHVYVPLLT